MFDLDTCSNSKVQSCHIVEGKIILILQGDDAGDDSIAYKAYTSVKLAFLTLSLDDQSRVSYIGNNPMSLPDVDRLSKRQDMAHKNTSVFYYILLAVTVLGTIMAIVVLIVFLRSTTDKNGEAHDDGSLNDEEKSTGVPGTICITLSSSSDGIVELGGNALPSPDHGKNRDVAEDEDSDEELDWCNFVYLQSLALSRVPEEASIDYECEERSI